MKDDAPESTSPADRAAAPFAWARTSGLGAELARETRARVRRRRRRHFVAGATLGLMLLGTAVLWRTGTPPARHASADASYKVSTPERRVLPDGSRIHLNAEAAIAVEYSPGLRRIVLLRGEALFEVAPDPSRPFVVATPRAEVRALGTVFSVACDRTIVDVVVTEGRVALKRLALGSAAAPSPVATADASTAATPADSAASRDQDETTVAIAAGNAATVHLDSGGSRPAVRAVSAAEVARRLAWRVPRLAFDGTPLTEVVRLFGEHGNITLTIADPAVRAVKVSGVLRADNPAALLQLLAQDHGIDAEPVGSGFALRRRR